MPERSEKRRRKEILDRTKADQRAAARAALPLANDHLKALFDWLDMELVQHGCDHSLRITRNWLLSNGLPEEPVVAWLRDHGGFCDCEALANAEQSWRDAIHDVNW